MWHIAKALSTFALWFSDGRSIYDPRGNVGESYRLIVNQQGFLDITEIPTWPPALDANGLILELPYFDSDRQELKRHSDSFSDIGLSLEIGDEGDFTLAWLDAQKDAGIHTAETSVSGKLKPLPTISDADVEFINTMIDEGYIPYQNIPESPGKSEKEIRALGKQFFPFTPHSFELALCVYDWTTASFTRLVLMKIFEYTGIPTPGPAPAPLDLDSIATQIWESDWPPYRPNDTDYMRSFMMTPADSRDDVRAQLGRVAADLQRLSAAENALLAAAAGAMPRTSAFRRAQLYSGQVDIRQLGREHFGIEFLESPLNAGPPGRELVAPFEGVLGSYVAPGKTITTKMVWSFTDDPDAALQYSNGILLVANIPAASTVWDQVAYITPLSDDPAKIEYVFAPRTRFEVLAVEDATIDGKQIVVISLRPVADQE
ncbi:hypothetical protein SAMD00023353_11100070 [Rosellinia necatrix]|uniref:Uncharacterized protein n=1 Tax=Rosellinia necatrix TaxID=77044 RepID=A0A1W2TWV4_ROSNE|nr:hypothetical protein SAMD00023353_11100070 [Rosellinia necatrix]